MVPNRIPFTYIEYAPAIYGHLRILKSGRPCAVPLHQHNTFIICVLRTDGDSGRQKILGTAKSKLLQVYFHYERRSVSSSLSMTSYGRRKQCSGPENSTRADQSNLGNQDTSIIRTLTDFCPVRIIQVPLYTFLQFPLITCLGAHAQARYAVVVLCVCVCLFRLYLTSC